MRLPTPRSLLCVQTLARDAAITMQSLHRSFLNCLLARKVLRSAEAEGVLKDLAAENEEPAALDNVIETINESLSELGMKVSSAMHGGVCYWAVADTGPNPFACLN